MMPEVSFLPAMPPMCVDRRSLSEAELVAVAVYTPSAVSVSAETVFPLSRPPLTPAMPP